MAERKRRLDLGEAEVAATGESTGVGLSSAAIPTTNPLTGKPYSAKYREIYEQRKKLPVWTHLDNLEKQLREHQVIVVEGETGSGKTTQVRTVWREGSGVMHACVSVAASRRKSRQTALYDVWPCRTPVFIFQQQ